MSNAEWACPARRNPNPRRGFTTEITKDTENEPIREPGHRVNRRKTRNSLESHVWCSVSVVSVSSVQIRAKQSQKTVVSRQ